MSTSKWSKKGCDACRRGILTGQSPPVRIGVAKGPIFLYHCERCGAYWLVTLREAHVISEEEARHLFPHVFSAKKPGKS